MVPYEPDVCNGKRRKRAELSLWLPRREAHHVHRTTKRFCAALCKLDIGDASATTPPTGEDLRDGK
jgi:hypothetical protein